jgi:hypothetical protein
VASFAQQTAAGKRKAPAKFTLLPEHFADSWGGQKPVAGVELGLRIPAEQELYNAQIEADRVAEAYGDSATLVRNAKLLAFLVARGICSPHDVTEPHPYFELPEDQVGAALKSTTIERIYDEIEKLIVTQSPVFAEASKAECYQLADLLLVDDPFDGVDPVKAAAARRYLMFALDILQGN